MKFGIVVFPGSNCDADCYHVMKHVAHQNVEYIWHKQDDIKDFDALILPGGFSYGDYLRTGAIASFSPIMPAVIRFRPSGRADNRHMQWISNPIGSRAFAGGNAAQPQPDFYL